jgi:hypothetical protein
MITEERIGNYFEEESDLKYGCFKMDNINKKLFEFFNFQRVDSDKIYDPCEVENGIYDVTSFLEGVSGLQRGNFRVKVPSTYRGKK